MSDKPKEGMYTKALRKIVSLYLIENIASTALGSHFQQFVEAFGALVDQHVPATTVVALSRQSLDLKQQNTVC